MGCTRGTPAWNAAKAAASSFPGDECTAGPVADVADCPDVGRQCWPKLLSSCRLSVATVMLHEERTRWGDCRYVLLSSSSTLRYECGIGAPVVLGLGAAVNDTDAAGLAGVIKVEVEVVDQVEAF